MRRILLLRHLLMWVFLIGLPWVAVSGVGDFTNISPTSLTRAVPPVDLREDTRRLPPPPVADQDWFLAVQDELRQLGATYVRLEKWHSEPAVYYFECRLPDRSDGDSNDSETTLSGLQRLRTFGYARRLGPTA